METGDNQPVRSDAHDTALLHGYRWSSDPQRIAAIGARPRLRMEPVMPYELANHIAIRHGELLANQFLAHPDFSTLAKNYLCGSVRPVRAAVHAHWPPPRD